MQAWEQPLEKPEKQIVEQSEPQAGRGTVKPQEKIGVCTF